MSDLIVQLDGEFEFEANLPFSISFHDDQNSEVGKLYYNDEGELAFKGRAEESAQMFFDYVAAVNNGEVRRQAERIEELEAVTKDMTKIHNESDLREIERLRAALRVTPEFVTNDALREFVKDALKGVDDGD